MHLPHICVQLVLDTQYIRQYILVYAYEQDKLEKGRGRIHWLFDFDGLTVISVYFNYKFHDIEQRYGDH